MVTTSANPETDTTAAEAPLALAAPLRLKLPDCWDPTDAALIELSQLNEPWDFELTADRELVFVSPERPGSSTRGAEILVDVGIWNREVGHGKVIGPQGGVRLPDSSMKMPDVAWISDDRWGDRDMDQKGLLDVCPELIVEVVSATDIPADQEAKMAEWIRNGALLGWLIDPYREIVLIYRPAAEPERLERPERLSGEDVCAGLDVRLDRIWR